MYSIIEEEKAGQLHFERLLASRADPGDPIDPEESPELMTLKEVQEATGLSMSYIRRRASTGKWTKHKGKDGRVRVPCSEVREYIRWKAVKTQSQAKRSARASKPVSSGALDDIIII